MYGYMLESNDDCESALPIVHKKEDALQFIPESPKEALVAFFIANAVRDLRSDKKTHRTMMINISRFIAVQNQITKVVDSCARDWKREIRNYYLTGDEALQYDFFRFIKYPEPYFQSPRDFFPEGCNCNGNRKIPQRKTMWTYSSDSCKSERGKLATLSRKYK